MIIPFAPAIAARRRLTGVLNRACIANFPTDEDHGKTRLCGYPIQDGYYCYACMARLKKQESPT